ncbi:traf2 and NCK-interacting protein kinase-like [Xenopus laevis]|uniref:Traf2 and NCK-interacting protein kinase-like n=2 Tax=Xenopus laevis TaxID=8355 RepID=A0A8J1KRX7_XENLA|nr:traf2 and NCK-interacting protein kinase-like [Xenopus laevis]
MLRRLRKIVRSCLSTRRKSSKIITEYEDPSGKLELENIVGEGAFGKVYKGRHLETNETVAIKVLDDKTNTEKEINNEIQLLKKYSKHENIASFFGVYLQPMGNLWIAMEYCGGGTVKDIMENTITGTLPEHWIAYIIREVLKALKYLHNNRVVHNDVKGHNIALTEDASVRLIDFGISQKLKGLRGACKDPVGTPQWLAPEVWTCSEDDTESYGCKCDLWSLGITAIEMAEGRDPLANLDGLLAGIKRCDPPKLRIPSKWSTEFNSFLGLCLKKDPKVTHSAKQLLKHPFVRNLENVKMVRAEMQAVICRVRAAKSKKVDVKPKEQPENISMGDFEKAMAELKSFQRGNKSDANAENLNAEAKKDATDSKELASQAEIDSANAEEPASVDKKEVSDALSNDEEKVTECNIETSDATEPVSQAKDSSDEELFFDALEQLSISDFTPKTEITATAANTGAQAIKTLEAVSESKEGAKRDGKAKEVIYKPMALFYFVRFALFLSELLIWFSETIKK